MLSSEESHAVRAAHLSSLKFTLGGNGFPQINFFSCQSFSTAPNKMRNQLPAISSPCKTWFLAFHTEKGNPKCPIY